MRREIVPFDEEVILSELDALPDRDAANVLKLIQRLVSAPTRPLSPILIEDYGDGIKCLRDVNAQFQNRTLFFVAESGPGYQLIVFVLHYKKETAKVPRRILELAKQRMKQWLEKRS